LVDSTYLLLAAIVIFDFVVSLWNAYSSGVIWGLLRNQAGHGFEKVCAVAGLGLAFAGMAYSTTIILSWVALQIGFIAIWDFLYLVSFDFLVFGAMIIGFGLLITVQSIVIAYRQRNFGSIAIASWNTFAEVWDIATYVQGFQAAATTVKGDRQDRANVIAILVVAVSVALIVTYFAFRAGLRKSEGAIADSSRQAAAENSPTGGFDLGHHRHLRTAILAGVVVLVVVVAVIVAFHFLAPSPQVDVQEIDVWAPSNVCGLNVTLISYNGFTDMPGASDDFQFQVENYNATACTLSHVDTNTSGFSLTNAQLPLTVAAGQSQFLNVTVNLPQGAFDGNLNLIYT
jgi:hypothetical protein